MPLDGRRMGFSPSNKRSLLFAFRASVTTKRGNYAVFIFENVFIVFVAGLPRKPKRPFADWYSTYARSFSKAACSFPTRKNCALLPIASAIPQNGAIRFVWQSLPPHQSTPVPTKQMPCLCNHRQQGFFVPHQDYPARVLCASIIRKVVASWRPCLRRSATT